MNTLLLVEDDKLLRETVRQAFEKDNFIVFEASACKRMVEILERHDVDLILLDLRLTDGMSLDFIPDIRKHTDVPIIVISGEKDPQKKIISFELGADDYVVKPFQMDELKARVKANLRRYQGFASNENTQKNGKVSDHIKFKNWTFDRTKHQIFDVNKTAGELTAREFQLLDVLISNAGQAVKRDDLCETICEKNYAPTPRSIDVKITRIRKKIGDDATRPQIIKTVRGVGYMFDQAVIEA